MNKNLFLHSALVLLILVSLLVSLAPTVRVHATEAEDGCWYYKADMSTPRRALAAAEWDNQIYVVGGRNGDRYDLMERYDPAGDSWTPLDPMPTARAWLVAAAASRAGQPAIFAIGGSDIGAKFDTVEMYDLVAEEWSSRTPMNHPRHGAVAGVVDNKIYVIGGWRNSAEDFVEAYDPDLDNWIDRAPIPEPVAMAAAAVVSDTIYVFGGLNDTGVLSSTYEYDPGANTWTKKADMPLPSLGPELNSPVRNRLAAAAVGDKIYVFGGINPQDRWLDTVQVYDPATDLWEDMNWMPTKRGELAAAAVGDTIYVFGGRRSWDSETVNYTQALNVACTNDPPGAPSNPDPVPGVQFQRVDLSLNWDVTDDDEVDPDFPEYDVFLGEEATPPWHTTPPLVSSAITITSYAPLETLKPGTKYYWRIVARDSTGAVTSGDLWGFRTGVGPSIDVTKTADPQFISEPGGPVTFMVSVTNTATETLTLIDLDDDVYGDLTSATDSTCTLTQALDPDEVYSCTFSGVVSGSAGDVFTDTVTASAQNAEEVVATAQATAFVEIVSTEPTIEVTKSAVPGSVPETGGTVEFSVSVQNKSTVPLTVTTLLDDVFGDLDGEGDCTLPQSLPDVGDSYACTFSRQISGNAGMQHTDTVTATATDGVETVEASDDASVSFTDVLPSVRVTKTADPTSLTEPGGTVDYTVVVTNTGVEAFTLAALTDDVFGDLNGPDDCNITETPPTVTPGQPFQCTFTRFVSGIEGDEHINEVTAAVIDDDDNPDFDTDAATVTFTDELPAISATYTADPATIINSGWVTFTVQVTNDNGVDAVNLTGLSDTVFGDLATECGLPGTIAAGDTWTCDIHRAISADHASTVTAIAEDEDNASNTAQASDDVEVDVEYRVYLPLIFGGGNSARIGQPGGVQGVLGNIVGALLSTLNAGF